MADFMKRRTDGGVMSRWRQCFQSVSIRAFFMIALLLVWAAWSLIPNGHPRPEPSESFSLLIQILLLILWIAAFGVWVFRPYRRCEEDISRFAEGYLSADALTRIGDSLTPMSRRAFDRLAKMMNSRDLVSLNRRQAQYLALQNQINPHFLYNTLDSIRSEAVLAGLDTVADMTEALAVFFRYTISKVENLVALEEELDNCRTYFKIQKYRFGDRLVFRVEYDEEDPSVLRCLVPKLMLQPIVENSIIHGTELKIGEGVTTISSAKTRTRLTIQVSDNGIGMDQQTLKKLNTRLNAPASGELRDESDGGIALTNVSRRIHLIYGEEYGLHVFSMENAGTVVSISLPVVTDQNQLKNQVPEGLVC